MSGWAAQHRRNLVELIVHWQNWHGKGTCKQHDRIMGFGGAAV
jgi:hypothetical protein